MEIPVSHLVLERAPGSSTALSLGVGGAWRKYVVLGLICPQQGGVYP